jgi:hypothetical protein
MSKSTKPTEPKTPAISGADEQAAHAVRLLDNLVMERCREMTERGQGLSAQLVQQAAAEATKTVLAYIKAKG